MHPPEVKQAALDLIAAGHNDCEVSRRTGIARGTIRDWRRPTYVRRVSWEPVMCPRCWRSSKPLHFTAETYAELFGLYLGDGSISESARTQRLRLYLDARYPRMNAEIRSLLERCFPHNSVGVAKPSRSSLSGRDDTWIVLSVYSEHLSCLFPQHGPGRKHLRRIRLEPWQEELVAGAPGAFLRGLIRSDGAAFINRTGRYEYLSYFFCNRSEDIAELFVRGAKQLGVDVRMTYDRRRLLWMIRVNRRASVARLHAEVGIKE